VAHASKQATDTGYDVVGFRNLEPGDSPRLVNRRRLAKRGEVTVTRKLPDRRARILFLVDVSGSQRLGSAVPKQEAVRTVLRGMGQACLARGDAITVVSFAERVRYESRVLTGRNAFEDALQDLTPPERGQDGSDAREVLARAGDLVGPPARAELVCIISDFLFPAQYRRQLSQLADETDLIAVVVRDPMETAVPSFMGALTLRDVETGALITAADLASDDPSAYLDAIGIDRCVLSTAQTEDDHYRRLFDFFVDRREQRR
jgi:uncharacterized protein (DUF58 family)